MLVFATISITCWLCALISTPHKPRLGNEVQELVYARLLGGQQRLVLLALLATMGGLLGWFITVRPSDVDADVTILPRTSTPCALTTYDPAPCGTAQRSVLVVRKIQDDGRSAVVATVVVPSATVIRRSNP